MRIIIFFLGTLILYGQNDEVTIDTLTTYYPTNEYNLKVFQESIIKERLALYDSLVKIDVEGYADYRGKSTYNIQLSKKRCYTVKEFIIEHYNSLKVTTKGNGAISYIDSLNTSDGIPIHRKTIMYIHYHQPKVVNEEINSNQIQLDSVTNYYAKLLDLNPGEKMVMRNINFEWGRTTIVETSIPELEKLFEILNNNENLHIEIVGHVCCGPKWEQQKQKSSFKNMSLSTNRALAVQSFLIWNGIATERLKYKGMGFMQPINYPEKGEKHRQENRRVELIVLKN